LHFPTIQEDLVAGGCGKESNCKQESGRQAYFLEGYKMQFEINEATVKQLAWAVKNSLGEKGHEVPNTALLEALSKGFGFECYRAIKGVAAVAEPSKFLPLARDLMKGENRIPVYLDVNYTWTDRQLEDKPSWAKLQLTEELLVRLFELQEEVNQGKVTRLTLNDDSFAMKWQNWAEREGVQEISVVRWGIQARLDFGKFGNAETRILDFENIVLELRERKPSQPVYVEIADRNYVLATDPDQQNRYIVAEGWGHCFAGSSESEVDFVYDTQIERIVYMRLRRSLGYERAHHSEIADVEDSVKNANEHVLENPEDEGFEVSDELPDWAQKYAASDRRHS
jgi:hypothetical protein